MQKHRTDHSLCAVDRDATSGGTSAAERRLGVLAVFFGLALLTLLSVRNGTFFDDEIASIQLIGSARNLREVIALANGSDVHPPLGFALDWLLLRLGLGLKGVQIVAGLANAAGLAAFVALAARALPRRAWWVLVGLAATAASAVLWGASLRWYAWFNPMFLLSLGLVLWSPAGPRSRLAVAALVSIVLFHTGYLAVIAAPLLWLAWLWRQRAEGRIRWRALTFAAGATVLACTPQAVVLWTVHLPNQAVQRGSLAASAVQTGTTLILGNAVQPLAPLPIAAGLLILSALVLAWRQRPILPLATLCALGAVLLAASGLGYKPRNAEFLALALLPVLATGLTALPRRWQPAAFALIALFQLRGYANVALHEGTAKRSFNTPYTLIVERVRQWGADCPAVVVSHGDPVLAHLLGPGIRQQGPFAPAGQALRPGDCLLVEDGIASAPSPADRDWIAARDSLPMRIERAASWRDESAFARAAALLGKTITPYAARLEKRRVTAPALLPPYGSPRAGSAAD